MGRQFYTYINVIESLLQWLYSFHSKMKEGQWLENTDGKSEVNCISISSLVMSSLFYLRNNIKATYRWCGVF
jgi:hypothetical protein